MNYYYLFTVRIKWRCVTVSLTDFDRISCKYLDFLITYESYRTKNKVKYSFACGYLKYQLLSSLPHIKPYLPNILYHQPGKFSD